MRSGTLIVSLVGGQGLKSADFFSKTDAYCILSCGKQTHKSNVATNQGSKPCWNQDFAFHLNSNEDVDELRLTVMDQDFFTADDELGVVKIPLAEVFRNGKTEEKHYKVVQRNGRFKGEIKLSLSFIATQKSDGSSHGGHHHHHHHLDQIKSEAEIEGPYGSNSEGGWKAGI